MRHILSTVDVYGEKSSKILTTYIFRVGIISEVQKPELGVDPATLHLD